MWYNPFTWFAKEEEEETYPYSYIRVEINPVAKSKGIFDEFNRVIKKYTNGNLEEEMPYTAQLLDAMKQIDEIPIYWEEYNKEDDEFEFYPFDEIGTIKYKK